MKASEGVPVSVDLSHHGQLSLQLLDAVFLEVELGAQHSRVLRGLLGLPPQVPLLPLQQVFLFGQHLHCILTLLEHREADHFQAQNSAGLEI